MGDNMTKVFKEDEVIEALKHYQKENIVSFPTDTVYGIGANLFNNQAIHKIYVTKHRPGNKPLAVLCADKTQMLEVVKEIPIEIEKLINRFMPGPLTVILPKKDEVPFFVTSNLETVGVRIPNHPAAIELLKTIGPMATTSANLSGCDSLNEAKDVIAILGEDIDIIIEGETQLKVPSTVVEIKNGKINIIREGLITKAMIEEILK